jgi:site-specific DNA recombinase
MRHDSKETGKLVGIWIRVSTEDQARGESPEHHEARARLYAESKGWNIKEVYHLEAMSGKTVMGYPETKRMLEDIKLGRISGLIFSKLARLARNTRELLEFAEIFNTYDADLISLQESIDTSTPAGRLFYTMIAAMAQWEREEIVERVAASIPIRAKLGKPLGGQAPFGYQWVDKKLVPNEKEAPVLKYLFELFKEHHRKNTVAQMLNQKGYRTRNGSKFSFSTVARLLHDSTSKGLHRLNHTKSLGDNKKWVAKPQYEWVTLQVPSILSDELWNTCNAILEEQERNKKPVRKTVHLFTGFAFCTCGERMYVPSNNPKYTCYKCHNKIGVDDLEAIFQEQLKLFLSSPEEIRSALLQTDTVIKEKEILLDTLAKESKKLEEELNHLVRLHLDGQIPKEGFGNHYRPLFERREQIEKQIPELQGELDFLKIQYLSQDEIINEAKDLYSGWNNLERQDKRKIIEEITDTIKIGSDEICINLAYLPSSKLTSTDHRNLMDS